ncbi:hypothetical protein ABT329_22580, partial [Streptomyces minutiscleroticus]
AVDMDRGLRPGVRDQGRLALAQEYPQVEGHAFFSAKEVAEDRIGAMARVVADHYGQAARRPR